jgi:hypothetical protein
MAQVNLILSLPQEIITATSLGIEGFAWHRSPGSGKYFQGRSVLVDLALANDKPDFEFLAEGAWRDTRADAIAAVAAARAGRRTKTALSCHAFSCTPTSAYRRVFLSKTGGQVLEMESAGDAVQLPEASCDEGMTPEQIAAVIGHLAPGSRKPRLYMVLAPVEFIMLSSLTPEEYAWYATHRPGKMFRQVLFTELNSDPTQVAAETVFEEGRKELMENTTKKTKTVSSGECLHRVPFSSWVGYKREIKGGIYVADRTSLRVWRFPEQIKSQWEKAA